MKRSILATLLIPAAMISSCNNAPKGEAHLEYEKYTLGNGLQVVLHEDKSDPLVAIAIQYNVGSKNERPGKTGFAHFFEHMLFQRSENLPRNAFFEKIDELGGSFNGGTSNDGTVYYEVVPRDALEKVLWMESDRIGYFINTVTQGGLEREIDVVANEKRQYENAPYGLENDLVVKNIFPEGHPYSWTVIGEIPDLSSATVDDVKEFYNTYYTTSNATMVIAGDFDKAEAKRLIEKYFGEIPARPAPAPMEVQNVKLPEMKHIYYEDQFANAPMALQVYPGVEAYNPDGYALDFLCSILDADKKSPLYKVLVEERRLMPVVNMYNYQMILTGIIQINGTTYPGVSLDDVYDGIAEAFARFEHDGVNPADLDRYKLTNQTKTYNRLTSANQKAMAMAHDNVFSGKPDNSLLELEHYNAVTPDDVMRVYSEYIKGQNFLTVSIVPAGQAELARTGSVAVVIEQESISEQELNSEAGEIIDDPYEKSPSKIDRSVEPGLLTNTPELNIPKIWTSNLSSGMIIKGIDYTELPLVYFAVELNEGMLHEDVRKPGVANLLAQMLSEGTAAKTPEELEEAIGQLGASIRVLADNEYMSLVGNCLKDQFPEVMKLVEEMILQPRWDEKSFETVKQRTIDEIRQNASQPSYIGMQKFGELLFGPENILSYPYQGTEESVEAITMDDLKEYYNNYLSPSMAKMSYIGGHSQQEVERVVAKLEADWPVKDVPAPEIPLVSPATDAKIYFIDYPDARQSFIIAGNRAMAASSPDAYPAVIVNDRLGGSTSSLFFQILRLQRGYTYGAYSAFHQAKYNNLFMAYSSVQAVVTKESVELFRDIISEYGGQYSQEVLDRTTSSLLLKMFRSFETPNSLLSMLRGIFIYDRPDDYIKQRENILRTITLDEAQAIIGRDLDFDKMIMVVVGDAKTQLKSVEELGMGKVQLLDMQGNQ